MKVAILSQSYFCQSVVYNFHLSQATAEALLTVRSVITGSVGIFGSSLTYMLTYIYIYMLCISGE